MADQSAKSSATERPTGPRGLPLVGNGYDFFSDPLGFIERCAATYGDIVGLNIAGSPAVLITHPEQIATVLSENLENYQKGELYKDELSFLGDGLLLSEGAQWRQQRQALAPMFQPDAIRPHGDKMVAHASRMVAELPTGTPVPIDEHLQELALEIVADALMDVDIRDDAPEIRLGLSRIMETARASSRIPVSPPAWMPTPGNIRYRRALETFHTTVDEIIDEHRAAVDPPDDVVTHLLAAQETQPDRITDELIRDELTTLLLAGHDTSALGMAYTLYLLAVNPTAQAAVHTELDEVLAGDPPTVELLPELTWTERAITEGLRLYPPTYLFLREAIADDRLGGYSIEPGTIVIIPPWLVHRDQRFFEAPNTYAPSRWTPTFESGLHSFAYFPFSGGPRKCIGSHFAMTEMQLVLATILQRFRVTVAFDPPPALEPRITLRPASSISLRLQER